MNNKRLTLSPLYIILIILGAAIFIALSVTVGFAVADIAAQNQSAMEDAELNEFELISFNNQFKALNGEQLAPNTRQMLQRVANHNKTTVEDRMITVTFLGKSSADPVMIVSYIDKVKDSKVYLLTLDYNEAGLVSAVIIEEIEN